MRCSVASVYVCVYVRAHLLSILLRSYLIHALCVLCSVECRLYVCTIDRLIFIIDYIVCSYSLRCGFPPSASSSEKIAFLIQAPGQKTQTLHHLRCVVLLFSRNGLYSFSIRLSSIVEHNFSALKTLIISFRYLDSIIYSFRELNLGHERTASMPGCLFYVS